MRKILDYLLSRLTTSSSDMKFQRLKYLYISQAETIVKQDERIAALEQQIKLLVLDQMISEKRGYECAEENHSSNCPRCEWNTTYEQAIADRNAWEKKV